MTEQRELKPCPFCGGRACLENHHRAFINGESTIVAFVRCAKCNARSGREKVTDYGRTSYSTEAEKKAVSAWNRRANDET